MISLVCLFSYRLTATASSLYRIAFCKSCTTPILTNTGSEYRGEPWLTRGARCVASRFGLTVVSVAVLILGALPLRVRVQLFGAGTRTNYLRNAVIYFLLFVHERRIVENQVLEILREIVSYGAETK